MIRILYVITYLYVILLECANLTRTAGSRRLLKMSTRIAGANRILQSDHPYGPLNRNAALLSLMLKKSSRKARSLPPNNANGGDGGGGGGGGGGDGDHDDDDGETFSPDTILVDVDKVNKDAMALSNMSHRSYNSTRKGVIIPLDEARKMTKHEPVKPIKFDIRLPEVPKGDLSMPAVVGHIDKETGLNLETRKLFVRQPGFPTTTSASVSHNQKDTRRTVKKDLSRTISNINV